MRTYINETEKAKEAVSLIVELVKSGEVESVISFDIETMPIEGLEQYPGTTFDEKGERISPKKKDYLVYTQLRWAESFNPERLARLGLFVPKKTTSGSERPGVSAKEAWKEFWSVLQKVSDKDLEAARWTAEEAYFYDYTYWTYRDWKQNDLAEIEGKRGKKKACDALRAEITHYDWLLERDKFVQARAKKPLDLRLLRHIVAVGVENRVKVDPAQPGLDPYTSDIFSVQVTLRRPSKELLTWVFNCAKVPLEIIRPVFRLKKVEYLAQNAKFDLKHLMHKLGEAPFEVYCTRVASRMLYLGLKMSHSLAALAERFCDVKVNKAVRDTFIGVRREEMTPEQIDYGAFDTEILFPIRDAQLKRAEEFGQVELIRNFSLLSYRVAKWELDGFLVDADRWMEIAAEVVRKRDEVATELEALLLPEDYRQQFMGQETDEAEDEDEDAEVDENQEVDPRKNAIIKLSQRTLVAELVSKVLGVTVTNLDKDTRGTLETEYIKKNGIPHPFFHLYERWAKLQKQATTYGQRFLWTRHPITGCFHSSFHIAGTDTSRFSSTAPNFLNVPTRKSEDDVDFRAAFPAPPGYFYGNADYSAMEQRIAADLTGDPTLVALFEEDGDGHSVSAALMWHIKREDRTSPAVGVGTFKQGTQTREIETLIVPKSWDIRQILSFAINDRSLFVVSKDGEEKKVSLTELIEVKYKKVTREPAKSVGFLFYFGGSAFGLAKKKNMPVDQAEEFFELFGAAYPQLVIGFERAGQQPFDNYITTDDGSRYGYATAYNGLRRWFRLPANPSRRDYSEGWAGDSQFRNAQYEYRKQRRAIEREAKNVGTQGGNGVVACEAILRLDQLGRRWGIETKLAIYDELLVLVPENVPEEIANMLIVQAMLEPSEKYIKRVPSKAEPNPLARCWVKY